MNNAKIGYKEVFTQKQYIKMTLANVINRFGDSIDSIALIWLVYALTGSASWSALIFGINQLPNVLLQPFVGPVVEGMNKKHVMVICDILRGFTTILLAVIYLSGYLSPYVLILYTLVNSTVECFRLPAGMAILPSILNKEYYEFGISLNTTASTVSQLIGFAVAGTVIAFGGIEISILIDSTTFFLSAFIISMIKQEKDKLIKAKLTIKSYIDILKNGFEYVIKKPVIRNFCIMAVILNALMVPFNSFQAPLIVDVYGQTSTMASVLTIGLLLGMGIGSLLFPFISKVVHSRNIIVLGGISLGIGYILFIAISFFVNNSITLYILCLLICITFGMGASLVTAVVQVEFIKQIEEEYLARTGAIFNACASAASPAMAALLSVMAMNYSVSKIFIVSGCLCVILFLYIVIKKVRFE